jgi:predicted nuclease with TOPRIM domain
MINLSTEGWPEILVVVSLAVIAIFIGTQKLLKDWKSTNAETSIITIMHEELERLSQQNTSLSHELGRLNTEIIKLNQELHNLTIENQRLHTEVVTLTSEVSRLQSILITRGPYGITS